MNGLALTLAGAAATSRAVQIEYDGKLKTVEVHAVGPEHARVFQIAGESSRPLPSWALIKLDKLDSVEPTEIKSLAPRDGYRKGDKQIKELLYEI